MAKQDEKISIRSQDPFLKREEAKYHHAIPSREWILEILNQAAVPVTFKYLVDLLSINADEEEVFYNRIKAMIRDGQVYINRRKLICIADKLDLIKCRIEGHKDGFGFGVPLNDHGEPDFILSEKKMRSLMDGDIVTIRATGVDRRGRREGRVVEILQRKHTDLVARLYIEEGVAIAIPEDKKISHTILLPQANTVEIISGQVAVITIDNYPNGITLATGHIKEILGTYADSGMEIEISVRKYDLPYIFSEECLREADNISPEISADDYLKRQDIRDLPLVTIDGETARDFDDAVYARKEGRNYRLIVAIADVSHYVKPDSALDKDALARATSVYFPRRVIPMLPEKLSNGVCSLLPNEERLCLVCDMSISYAGNIKSYQFYPAVMRSHARLTYTEVWDYLQNKTAHPFKEQLDVLYSLYKILAKKRFARGAIEFDSVETQMKFDENNKIKAIVPVQRNDAHRLIEECMLAANVSAADFLLKQQHSALYRVHLGPTNDKLLVLRAQLSLLGLFLGGKENPTPKDYAVLFEKLAQRTDKELIQMMLLRSMQQAVYQVENIGHFGLAYEAYAHFTSPIRRYPDLLVHRAIKAILNGKIYQPKSWSELGAHCSYAERRAEEASRDVEKWLKTYYMRDKVGEIFEGSVSGLTNFGLFVMLKNIYVEGMIHISDLGQDYFNYYPERLSIIGERTKISFTMGDNVIVKVAQANLDTCRVDLVLVSGGTKSVVKKDQPGKNSRSSTRKNKSQSLEKQNKNKNKK